jgi:1,4-dihydroxy-6-naphthoate synthase
MESIPTGCTTQRLTFGYSPCPNDTFMFHGIASGALELPGFSIEVRLHDIETLNRMALEGRLDISKLSFFAWLKTRDAYHLMNSGAALGFGCGPVVIAKQALGRKDIAGCRVAFPGEWTTAHLLFRLWAPEAENRYFTTYDRICDDVASGRADCGVIIHESRFTYEHLGFRRVIDLGQWWEEQTGLPIPLGGIAARTALGPEILAALDGLLRRSIERAQQNPEAAFPYIRQHAQEMELDVLQRHIATFVNSFSSDLGAPGRQALKVLEQRARDTGVLP